VRCDQLQQAVAAAATLPLKRKALKAQQAHHLEADRAYAMRKNDRGLDPQLAETIVSDMQGASLIMTGHAANCLLNHNPRAVRSAPERVRGFLSAKRASKEAACAHRWFLSQVKVRNYDVWASSQRGAHCSYVWCERTAEKGANNVLSAVHLHLERTGPLAPLLIWWADNTSSQVCHW
jgi:hypothetical protein